MNITVYCGSNPGHNQHFKDAAKALGEWIANEGHTLVYGGSSVGLMGIVSQTVLDLGGTVIGVEPRFFIEAGVAQHDLTELHVVETMNERKAKMIELGEIFITLPGGIGTLEEVSEIMSRIRLGLGPSTCFLLNIDHFYDSLKNYLHDMIDAGFLDQVDLDRYHFVDSIEELAVLLDQEQANPTERFATAAELNPVTTQR